MEAQLCGLAAVSTAISAIPELIEDGVNGLLVPQRNPDELAKALQTMISNPKQRDEMGRKGNEIVRRDFSFYSGMKDLAHRFGVTDVNPENISSSHSQKPAAE